tara:strand:- start:714 stop:2597 length:1884 start_codon:yes stop_codon:yes gene_type:complete
MSQVSTGGNYDVANSTGANVRADINEIFDAILTMNSGSSAPSYAKAYTLFADTNAGIMKMRNAANDGFINLFTLAGGVDVDAASNFNEDVTFTGASANILFDKSANRFLFADNTKAIFGTGTDLEIYHDGSNSYVNNTGTGVLILQGNGSSDVSVRAVSGESGLVVKPNAAVEAYYDNTKRIETLSTGAKVTGRLGIDKTPTTLLNAQLSVFAATGDDDASDWGADGIFQLDHSGTSAANNEILMIGAVSGGVGQIASGFGFGRESTSNWGTYISFKTHSTSTSNIDELKERWKITSAGHFENNSDSIRIKLGASDDLQIYHDGSNSHLEEVGTGALLIKGDTVNLGSTNGEFYFRGFENGESVLRFDNSTKVQTHSGGVNLLGSGTDAIQMTGDVWFNNNEHAGADIYFNSGDKHLIYEDNVKAKFGGGGDLQIYHDGGDNHIDSISSSHKLKIQAEANLELRRAGANEAMAIFSPNGASELYYDNTKRLETLTDGAQCKGVMHVQSEDGNVIQTTQAFYHVVGTNSSVTITLTGLIGSGRFVAGGYANAGQGALGYYAIFGGAMFATQHYQVNELINSGMQNISVSTTKNNTSFVITVSNGSSSSTLPMSGFLESTGSQMAVAFS